MENIRQVQVLIDWVGNYCACAEGVEGCISTGDTMEEVKRNYVEALAFHLDGYRADGEPLPEAVAGPYKLCFVQTTAALLHSLDGILTRKAIARVTGINEKQLTHYASGTKKPRPQQRERILSGVKQLGKEIASIEYTFV